MVKDPKELDTFFLTFSGQDIIVSMKQQAVHTIHTENGPVSETVPLFYEGILLDYDDENFYLGEKTENGLEIKQAINRNEYLHIMLNETEDILKTVLTEMDVPQNNDEIN